MQESITRRRQLARVRASSAYSARKSEVLAAAAEVFRRHGFNGTSMGTIADATGLSRASLYYYLSSKQDLYREVVTGAVEANVKEIKQILATDAPPAEKVSRAIVALMRSFDTHYPFLQVYVQEAVPKLSTPANAWVGDIVKVGRRYEQALTAIVQEGLDRGDFSSVLPAKVLAYGIIGMVNWTCRWYRPGREYSNREIGTGFAAMAVDGLTGRGNLPPAGGASRARKHVRLVEEVTYDDR
jgi:AcrR family transcriptional regulator